MWRIKLHLDTVVLLNPLQTCTCLLILITSVVDICKCSSNSATCPLSLKNTGWKRDDEMANTVHAKNIYVLCGVIITLFINKDILREAKLTSWNIFMQTHRDFFLMLLIPFVAFGKGFLPQHMWRKKISNVECSNVLFNQAVLFTSHRSRPRHKKFLLNWASVSLHRSFLFSDDSLRCALQLIKLHSGCGSFRDSRWIY